MCVTVGRSFMCKFTGELARSVYSETMKQQLEIESLLLKKECFEGIPSKSKCVCKFADCFFQRLPIAGDALLPILQSS